MYIDHGKIDDLKAGYYHIFNDNDEHIARVYGYENALLFLASDDLLEALQEMLNQAILNDDIYQNKSKKIRHKHIALAINAIKKSKGE